MSKSTNQTWTISAKCEPCGGHTDHTFVEDEDGLIGEDDEGVCVYAQDHVRHEVEVDTRIADAFEVASKARQHLDNMQQQYNWSVKNGRIYDQETYLCKRDDAHTKFTDLIAKVWELETEYEGWSRFFIVKNVNGHIHSSMSCSTCYPTTQYGWLPELSGLTEADAVEEYGGILCSVCFPSAPVEWTTGTNKKDQAEKDLHKALQAIERSPEGKKIKTLKASLSSKQYSLNSKKRELIRIREDMEDTRYEVPAHQVAKLDTLPADITKLVKQVDAYQSKIEAAEKALEEVLKS